MTLLCFFFYLQLGFWWSSVIHTWWTCFQNTCKRFVMIGNTKEHLKQTADWCEQTDTCYKNHAWTSTYICTRLLGALYCTGGAFNFWMPLVQKTADCSCCCLYNYNDTTRRRKQQEEEEEEEVVKKWKRQLWLQSEHCVERGSQVWLLVGSVNKTKGHM